MPTILGNIKDFVRRLLGIKKKVLVGRILKDEEISQLPKEVEYERGYKEGQITALEEDVKELKRGLSPKDLNLAEYLTKQREHLYLNQFKNSLSLKSVFAVAGLPQFKKKGIKVLSFNMKKNFGELDDILIRPDGRISVVTKNGKRKSPLITGHDVHKIFTNFRGLLNSANEGIVQVNLDEKQNYVPNVYDEEIPELVQDGNGRIHIARVNTESFMKQLIDKEGHINELYGMLSAYEREIHKLTSNKNLFKVIAKFNEGRATTSEAELAKAISGISEINKNFTDLSKENAVKGHSEWIANKKIGTLEEIQENIIKKMNEVFGKPETDIAREQYKRIAEDILDLTQGSKIVIQQPAQQPKPEEGTLTEKFKGLKLGSPQ